MPCVGRRQRRGLLERADRAVDVAREELRVTEGVEIGRGARRLCLFLERQRGDAQVGRRGGLFSGACDRGHGTIGKAAGQPHVERTRLSRGIAQRREYVRRTARLRDADGKDDGGGGREYGSGDRDQATFTPGRDETA